MGFIRTVDDEGRLPPQEPFWICALVGHAGVRFAQSPGSFQHPRRPVVPRHDLRADLTAFAIIGRTAFPQGLRRAF
jgi:hypothetical protein